MRWTVSLPRTLREKVKLAALRDGQTVMAWVVQAILDRLSR